MNENNFRELATERNGGDSRDIIENKNRTLKKIAAAIQTGTLLVALGWDMSLRAAEEDSHSTETSSKIEKKEAHIQKELQKIIGEYVITAIPDKIQEKADEKPPEVGRFSIREIEGVVAEEKMLAILETLPSGWVNGEVTSIKEKPGKEAPPSKVIKQKEDERLFTSAYSECSYGESAIIEFYRYEQTERNRNSVESLMISLYHELAHGNSWYCDNQMDRMERLKLLYIMLQRISERDRYMSTYVETLEPEDGTQESKAYLKANEYWAVIVSKYFSDPHELSNTDFLIVDNLVRKHDPQYNAIKSAAKRRKIISAINQDIKNKRKELKRANKEAELARKINSPENQR